MSVCAVATCKNTAKNTDKDVIFHRFPKNISLQKLWLMKCKRADRKGSLPRPGDRICSSHFSSDDYNRDLVHELLKLPIRKIRHLKDDAVPSVNMPKLSNSVVGLTEDSSINRLQRCSDRAVKKEFICQRSKALPSSKNIVLQIRISFHCSSNTVTSPTLFETSGQTVSVGFDLLIKAAESVTEESFVYAATENQQTIPVGPNQRSSSPSSLLLKRKSMLTMQSTRIKFLERKIGLLNKRLMKKNIKISFQLTQIKKLEKEKLDLKINANLASETVKQKLNTYEKNEICLAGTFSKSQTKRLFGEVKKSHWEDDVIVSSIGLFTISQKGYEYCRNILKYPLPAPTTLRTWVKHVKVRPGIIPSSVQLLKTKATESKSPRENVVVLSFDEMNIKNEYSYSHGEDKVYIPYKKLMVVLARGLFKNFKIPIYINFDFRMTKDMLIKIIGQIHDSGCDVAAIVCDQAGENRALWNDFGLKTDSFYINVDKIEHKIYIFYDVPHALKNCRNHILDSGLELPSGKVINKALLSELLSLDFGEFKGCAHLRKDTHLNVKGSDRQRVRPAAQLLGRRTGLAIKTLLPYCEEQAEFIIKLDMAFDTLNSRLKEGDRDCRCGFGVDKVFEIQKNALRFLEEEFSECRFIEPKTKLTRNTLLPCQSALIIAAKNMLKIYNDLKLRYGIEFILSARLNQDCLENFFSRVRYFCNDNMPNPVSVLSRIKILLLGVDTKEIIKNAPVANEIEADDCLNDGVNLLKPSADLLYDERDDVPISNSFDEFETVLEEIDSGSNNSMIVRTGGSSQFEELGLAYVSGFLASKLKNDHPNLASNTPTANCQWIQALNYRGLTYPSVDFQELLKEFEVQFTIFHKSSIDTNPNVIKRFIAHLAYKYPYVDQKILKLYSRTRFFIRFNNLRKQYNEAKNDETLRNQKKAKMWLKSK